MERFVKELNAIYEETNRQIKAADAKVLADTVTVVYMIKTMVEQICEHAIKKAENDEAFKKLMAQEHKSAKRLLKYIFTQAQKFAVEMSFAGCQGKGCFFPDDVVFGWIEDYYNLDDKAEVEAEIEAERKKKEEAEKKAKEEAERKAQAREKAIEKLSNEEGFSDLSDDEKEKKISEEVKKILPRLGKKSSSKSKASRKKAKNTTAEVDVEAINEALPENAKLVSFEESGLADEIVAEIEIIPDEPVVEAISNDVVEVDTKEEEGKTDTEVNCDKNHQFTLFDLINPS